MSRTGPKTRNDRIIAVPTKDERYDDVEGLPKNHREELERFFITTSEVSSKKVTVEGWEGPKRAEKLVERAALRYLHQSGRGR